MQKFTTLSDQQILSELGQRFDKKRIQKGIMDKSLIKQGGVSSDALNKFRQASGGITLLNFVRLLRGINELDALEKLISVDSGLLFSENETPPRKRIRHSLIRKKSVNWGEDQ
ncbi:MAG: hypothetical protein COA86_18530 [Kangiella sp.]|nr:MAG: hypothetical protein COA86_18530 [Kangiella sp.]